MEFPSPSPQETKGHSNKKTRIVFGVIGVVVFVVSMLDAVSNMPGFHCVYEFPREGICAGMNYTRALILDIGGIVLGSLFMIMAFNKKGTLPF